MWRLAVLAVLAGCGVTLEGAGPADARPADAARDARVVPLDAPVDARPCIDGDARAAAPDGSCLIWLTTPQTFADGTLACAALGAHLAILRSAAVDDVARSLVGNRDTFIGLTDEVEEGRFVWVDGSALVFTNWDIDEPNDNDGRNPEDCAIIAGARVTKLWDDRPCGPTAGTNGGSYAVLCQRE